MIIDFHTHTFPDKIAAMALAKMQSASHSAAFTAGTQAALTDSMAAAGIDWSVVLPVATNPAKVSAINDLSIRQSGQERLIFFACIHPDMPDAAAEIARAAAGGLRGVKIHPVYQGVDIDDMRYLRILEAAGQHDMTVVMHSGDDIGFPGVVRCSPSMTLRALAQVGPVRLVAAHMGGWRNWDEACALAEAGVYIDTAFSLGSITPIDDHYAPEELALMSQDQFTALVRTFGADRVLFGTDSPWDHQTRCVTAIQALPLTEAERALILGGNAQRILGI